ncbi:hypothetical protein GCM10010349_72850 [Streptomyces flavofungini]|nr:hypothetical protein GCM10010349_72850 [Streptomyces flavofungini]
MTWNGAYPSVPTLIRRKLKPQIRDRTAKRTRQSKARRPPARVAESAAEVADLTGFVDPVRVPGVVRGSDGAVGSEAEVGAEGAAEVLMQATLGHSTS